MRSAFLASYTGTKKKNEFTKVQMRLEADVQLREFFGSDLARIEAWFNVIAPAGKTIEVLKSELAELRRKDWLHLLR